MVRMYRNTRYFKGGNVLSYVMPMRDRLNTIAELVQTSLGRLIKLKRWYDHTGSSHLG